MSTEPTADTVPRVALAAGGLAALLASACCVAPLVLIGVGLSGAWMIHLQALEPLQPLFLAVALGALAIAGWRLWRPVADCNDGAVCARPGARRAYRALFVAVAMLVLAVIVFPWFAPLFY